MPSFNVNTDDAGEVYIALETESRICRSLQCLAWDERDGISALPQPLALYIFMQKVIPSPECLAHFKRHKINIFKLKIARAYWTKLIEAMTEASLFEEEYVHHRQFLAALEKAHVDWQALHLLPEHVVMDEPGTSASARSSKSKKASTSQATDSESQEEPEKLKLLAEATIDDIMPSSGPSLQLVARLAATLGPCLSRQQRMSGGSEVNIVAAILEKNISSYLGDAGGTVYGPSVLAASLAAFLEATVLPEGLVSTSTSQAAFRAELVDGIRCGQNLGKTK